MKKRGSSKVKNKPIWKTILKIGLITFGVLFLMLFSFIILIGLIFSGSSTQDVTGNVAVIPIKGTIFGDSSGDIFNDNTVSSSKIIELIDEAVEDESIDAIVFEINSPGGSAVASEELSNAIKTIEKPTVGWIREIGTSGAYWAASATDHIIASSMSITGSIGVIASYLEFSGLLDDYNITYQRMVSGKFKDIGSPFKKITTDEQAFFQNHLDIIHNFFIDSVAENRNLPREEVSKVAEGLFYSGAEALDLKLVDQLGSKPEVKIYLETLLNKTVDFKDFKEEKGLLDFLSSAFSQQSFAVGQGIGSSISKQAKVKPSYSVWT